MMVSEMKTSTDSVVMTRSQVVKRLRRLLDVTQTELAAALDISAKAVQSYEQGWRDTPLRIVKQMLTLVAMNRTDKEQAKPCWIVRSCDPEHVETCPANKITHGHYCWSVASKSCAKAQGDADPSVLGCLDCDVVKQFIDA
jgi:DNA-binding transcriptional regulator YiaG